MRTFTLVEEQSTANDQDALFQHVFDNLRNVIICAILTLAGAGVIKFRASLEPLDSTINAAVGILLILTAFFLCGWNMANGYKKIVTSTRGTTKAGVYLLALLIYGFLIFAVLQAWAMLQAKQLHNPASDTAVERAQPAPAPFTLTLDCSLDPGSACIKSVVLVPYIAYQENMLDSSAVFLIEGYIPWTDALL
jgi:hypothetical protein